MPADKNRLRITVDQQTVPYQPDSTVLESLERHNIEVHFHCREGFCGACRTRLIEGEVEYQVPPLAFIDDDEILPCCCKPLTDLELETE